MKLLYTSRQYELGLELTGKFNVVIGNSGAGKTLLARIASRFMRAGDVEAQKPKPIYSSCDANIIPFLESARDSVFIIDEDTDLSWIRSSMPLLLNSDNYYVFITRDGIPEIPYGISNIFRVSSNSGRKCYMIPLYRHVLSRRVVPGGKIVTEDSKLGYQHLCHICGKDRVMSAEGKSKIYRLVDSMGGDIPCTVVFDSCGIGADAAGLIELQRAGDCTLFDSASFEQEVLSCDFPKLYREFTESDIPAYHSEEDFYISQLSDVLNKLWGIRYHKNDTQLSQLLETGIANIHGKVCRMKDAGGVTGQTYRELRDDQPKQDLEPAKKLKSISKMSLG